MELNEGDVFAGRFRLVKLLGRGGFGEVHEAEELKSGERVALKVLHLEMVSHPTLRERFEQESRITSMFKSLHCMGSPAWTAPEQFMRGASSRPRPTWGPSVCLRRSDEHS